MTDQIIHNTHELDLVPYLDVLGLDHAPFVNTENVDFYSNPDLLQQLNLVHHLLESSNLIILLLGEPGIGKSTLLQQAISHANPNWVITQVKATTELTDEDILHSLAHTYNLPTDCGHTALLHLLDEQLADFANLGQSPILFIDDAHNTSVEVLQFLINCATGIGEQNGKCHVILFSEPILENRLQEIEINASNDERFHLNRIKPFTEQQTKDYVLHCLQSAGMSDDKTPLVQGSLDTIYNKSHGIPTKINKFSHLSLMDLQGPKIITEKAVKQPPVKKKRFPISGFFAGLFAVVGIAVILFLQDQINAVFKSGSVDTTSTSIKKTEAVQSEDLLHAFKKSQEKLTEEASSEKLVIDDPQSNKQMTTTKDLKETTKLDKDYIASIKPGEDVSLNTTDTQNNSLKPISKPAKIEPSNSITPKINEKNITTKPTIHKKPVAKSTEIKKNKTDSQLSLTDKSWILKQNPEYFSLQILGSRNEHILMKYISDNKIMDKAKRYKVNFKGGDWHVLIYGAYKTRNSAKIDIKQLPKVLQSGKPWVRPFKDIQSEIRKGTK